MNERVRVYGSVGTPPVVSSSELITPLLQFVRVRARLLVCGHAFLTTPQRTILCI